MVLNRYNVIVIGGGHAGIEAAWAAANLLPCVVSGSSTSCATGCSPASVRPAPATSCQWHTAIGGVRNDRRDACPTGERPSVALVTLDPAKIGEMSCNPAIGGLAKGQLVREIDAMGGLMGLLADATGIHFKVLNTSKGPAVQGPRCQSDKAAYAEAARGAIASRPEIEIVAGAVETLRVQGGPQGKRITGVGVRTPGGDLLLEGDAVVLTTGTFMRALMHVGDTRTPGGRFGEAAAGPISDALRGLGFELGRLKTGTPPRLRRGSIDWESLPEHAGDNEPRPFSDLSGHRGGNPSLTLGAPFAKPSLPFEPPFQEVIDRFPVLEQVDCRRTHTTPDAHELIRANLHRAPLFTGQIAGAGPRYCPSIEDKVVRFEGRDSHGVYLEPESLRTDWVYCNGISSSLPADVQDAIVRTMPGCEHAEILRYGYAVEYDMVKPHQIRATCETHAVGGLFLAGQINGTSGYEEAAAQGLIAGINAARLSRGEPADFVLGRDEAYIGVLMDDLVTKTPVEPYRMFTSRAEHRLLLRADNAADRLTPVADRLGLLASTALGRLRADLFDERRRQREVIRAEAGRTCIDGVPLRDAARRHGFSVDNLRSVLPGVRASGAVWASVLADLRYEPYVRRQSAEVRRQASMEGRRIPSGVVYARVEGLRREAREALERYRPETFGQAGRLEGVTPADLTLLAVHARKSRRVER